MTPDEALRLVNRCFRVAQRNIPHSDSCYRLEVARRLIEVFEDEGHELPVVHRLADVSELEHEIVDGYLEVHPDPAYEYVASAHCFRCRHPLLLHRHGDPKREELRCLSAGCLCECFSLTTVAVIQHWLDARYPAARQHITS